MMLELEEYPDIQKIFMSLVFIEILFFTLDIFLYTFKYAAHSEIIKLFDITLEANLPTWFSSTQALAVALVAYLIVMQKNALGGSVKQYGWIIVTLFFLYLAVDDAAQIHERLSTALNASLQETESFSNVSMWFKFFPSYHWQIVFLPVFAVIGLYMLNLMYREFGKSISLYFFLCGGFFYVFAVILDYVEGANNNYLLLRELTYFSVKDIVHILRAIEEVVEMFGTSLILVAFLIYLADLKKVPSLSIEKEKEN